MDEQDLVGIPRQRPGFIMEMERQTMELAGGHGDRYPLTLTLIGNDFVDVWEERSFRLLFSHSLFTANAAYSRLDLEIGLCNMPLYPNQVS